MKVFTITDAQGRPYLTRHVIAEFPDGSKIYLHQIHQSDDDRDFHDHPWPFKSHIVSGSYIEHTPDKPPKTFKPGDWNERLDPAGLHRLELVESPVFTLVYRGPTTRVWGFQTPPAPWRTHVDYLDEKFGPGNWSTDYE